MNQQEKRQNTMASQQELYWYLQDLANTPMLSLQEEKDIVQQIAIAPHSAQAEAARTFLVEAHLRLVVHLAHRYQLFGLALADLVQEGNIALMKAAQQFDPQRCHSFRGFARQRITWRFYRVIEKHLREHHILDPETSIESIYPLRTALVKALTHATMEEQAVSADLPAPRCVSLDLLQNAEDRETVCPENDNPLRILWESEKRNANPDTIYLAQEQCICIAFCLAALTTRERFVLTRRFLLDEKQTLEQIGRTLGVTREMVRQIEKRSLKKLRHPRLAEILRHVL